MHIPVLLHESIDGLEIKPGDIFLDGTLGGGGHSHEVCKRFGRRVRIIGLDRDIDAINRSKKRFESEDCDASFILSSFAEIKKALNTLGVEKVDKILLDLGISSFQLDDSGRGFTFRKDEPLLMTMKKNPELGDVTAEQIVNEWDEESIADILYGYGEERYARRIARFIVESRKISPIKTTFDLVGIIERSVPAPYKRGKTHFATRTFQALRIAVNDELRTLTDALDAGFRELSRGGRMAIISFHSLEDRIVKNFFKEMQKRDAALLITKKPIIPTEKEIEENPRSRSAKLRILEKIT